MLRNRIAASLGTSAATAALIGVYVLLALFVVGMLLLLLNPYLGLYQVFVTGLTVSLSLIAFRYVYFYYCVIRYRHDFDGHACATPAKPRNWPYLKFQVTTKGGALETVERSLHILEDFCRNHRSLATKIRAEVITEKQSEAVHLDRVFATSPLKVSALCLPPTYQTPRGTKLKARGMHYLVELRRRGFNKLPGKTYIVHLDDETIITEEELTVLGTYLSRPDAKPITEGPIYYPLEWADAPWICRTVESIRPFGCSECAHVMQNPPPSHLHGSNLVVEEQTENLIGWDIGTLDGQPFIAEDLVFGLKAYSMLGPDAFGWHGATMYEQPPFSLYWSFRQRQRWVLGAMQGLRALWRSPDFEGISRWRKARIQFSVSYRLATYVLGFPVGLAGFMFLIRNIVTGAGLGGFGTVSIWTPMVLVAGVGWLLSYQIGLARNLRLLNLPWHQRLKQHLVVLAMTPVAGLADTIGPFTAAVKWTLGLRRVSWKPTLKVSGQTPAAAPPPPVMAPEIAGGRGA